MSKVHQSLYEMLSHGLHSKRSTDQIVVSHCQTLPSTFWGLGQKYVVYDTLELLRECSSHLPGIQYGISFGSNGRQLGRIVKVHNRQSSKAPQRYVNPNSAVESPILQTIDCANSLIMAAGNDFWTKNFV